MSGIKFMGKNPSGNAMGINVDAGGNIKTTTSINRQIMVYARETILAGQLTLGTNYPVDYWEYNKETVIDELEWVTDNPTNLWLRIFVKLGGEWKESNYKLKDDFSLFGVYSATEIAKGTNLWNILTYDTTNKIYRFSLRKPIHAAEGIRIYFDNREATSSKVGIVMRGRTTE